MMSQPLNRRSHPIQEHADYEIIHSSQQDQSHIIIRVNIFKTHRQVVQYIMPTEAYKLSQAELLFVDEAAAIPLPLTQKLLGPYITFLSSTITGYEGTGRSLSLKLINELRRKDAGCLNLNLSLNCSGKSVARNRTQGTYPLRIERPRRKMVIFLPLSRLRVDAVPSNVWDPPPGPVRAVLRESRLAVQLS